MPYRFITAAIGAAAGTAAAAGGIAVTGAIGAGVLVDGGIAGTATTIIGSSH
jgi:hypothetical protein